MNGLLTLQECAKMLKVHEMTIRRYIKSNKLKAYKVGGLWRIAFDELKRFMGDSPLEPGESCGQAQDSEDA